MRYRKDMKSIKISPKCIWGAILGASLVCSPLLAQSGRGNGNQGGGNGNHGGGNGNKGPDCIGNPNPPPGVNGFGVAVPVPVLNIAQYLPGGTNEDPDVVFLIQRIQLNYTNALEQLATTSPGSSPAKFTQALGKALIYDQKLSVNKNLACATCHIDYSGFTGGSSFFNGTTSADPGSVPITNAGTPKKPTGPDFRISARRPQTYAYAPFSPVLHFNNTVMDFYGGNFWDMRAGGIRLENPAAEQAQGPPTNPVEMGNLDIATYVYKISISKEAPFFEAFWGKGSLSSIHFPGNIAELAAQPGPAPANN